MTGAAALAYFTLELGRACAQLGAPAPAVHAIYVHERHPAVSSLVVAYVNPTPPGFVPEVFVTWHLLWGGNKPLLRCVARHEAAHLALGHASGARNEDQLVLFEDLADDVIARRWHERPQCGLRRAVTR